MSKTYQYIVDIVSRTQKFTSGMQSAVREMKTAERAAENLNKATSSVTSGFKNVIAATGLAFGIREVFSFTQELVKLGGEADGVSRAFYRIANQTDLNNLKASVKGTVSELELMKRAVSANNFGIPIQELGSLMEFAAKRAQDTGQSVDYLVDSIVTGIGRKSPLILDNLGISAAQLKEKLNGVSVEAASVGDVTRAVGAIARESLNTTGGLVDTNSTKIQRITADWENLKKSLATSPVIISKVAEALTEIEMLVSGFASMKDLGKGILSDKFWQDKLRVFNARKINQSWGQDYASMYGEGESEIRSETAALNGNTSSTDKNNKKKVESLTAYEELSKRIAELSKKQEHLATLNSDISPISAQITALQQQKEAIDKVIAAQNFEARYGKIDVGGKIAGIGTAGVKSTIDFKDVEVEKFKEIYGQNLDEIAVMEENFIAKHQAIQGALQGGFEAIGKGIVDSLGFAEKGLEGFIGAMFETATKVISMMLAQSIANAIFSGTEMSKLLGPAAMFAAPALITTAIGGVMSAFAAIPKFAKGGIAYGPTLGMFGEYAGASGNPEVVAPLDRLRDLIQPGGGTTVIMPAGVEIDGYKLRVLLKKVDKSLNLRS
jgi:hypothetical protein